MTYKFNRERGFSFWSKTNVQHILTVFQATFRHLNIFFFLVFCADDHKFCNSFNISVLSSVLFQNTNNRRLFRGYNYVMPLAI